MQINEGIDLARIILPKEVLDYFTITQIKQNQDELSIYLDEINKIPSEYINDKVITKGFYEEAKIQDFPIRGKAVYLYVRRRRWLNESTGEYVCRDWNLLAKGTRMTQEFASFLKVISRYQAGKL